MKSQVRTSVIKTPIATYGKIWRKGVDGRVDCEIGVRLVVCALCPCRASGLRAGLPVLGLPAAWAVAGAPRPNRLRPNRSGLNLNLNLGLSLVLNPTHPNRNQNAGEDPE